jgi:hypothetical protein
MHIRASARQRTSSLQQQSMKAQQKLSAAVTQAYNDRTNDDSVLGERDMWQYLRNICPKHVTEQVFHAIRHPNGGTATSAEEIADAFKCHYERLGSEAWFCAANAQFDTSARHDISCEVQMHLLDATCPLD